VDMNLLPEIVVDCFAGGGGASEGMERALHRLGEFDFDAGLSVMEAAE